MIKPLVKPRPRRQNPNRGITADLRRLRTQAEDLLDLLEALEARARNLGKPRIPHAVIMEKYGVK